MKRLQNMAQYKITGNLYNTASGMAQVDRARQYESSTAMSLLNSLKGVADTAQAVSAVEFEKEIKNRQNKAIEQGVKDGSVGVSPEQYEADLREGDSVYDQAYNKAQRAAVASNISTLARTESARLAEMYKDDPDAYTGAQVGLFETIVEENQLGVETQQLLWQEMQNESSRYLPTITQNGYRKAKDAQFAAQRQEYDVLVNTALNSARNGDMSKYKDDRDQMIVRLDLMKQEGMITDQQYNDSISNFDKEVASQMLLGDVGRSLEKGSLTGAIGFRNSWESKMRETGLMSPDEIDAELRRVDSQIDATRKAFAAQNENYNRIGSVWDKEGVLDYKDTKDKKAVDNLTTATLGANPDYTNVNNRNVAIKIARETGIVPSSYTSFIRSTQFSEDPQVVIEGVTSLQQLLEINPAMKDQMTQKDITFADNVTGFMKSGMDAESAIAATREQEKVEFKDRQEANLAIIGSTEDYNTLVTDFSEEFIEEETNRWFEWGETVTDEQRIQLTSDYNRIFKYHLGTTANQEAARLATERDMRNKYGITYINGKREFTSNPVEQKTLGIASNQVTEDNPVAKQWQQDREQIAKDLGLTTQKRTGSEREGTLVIEEVADTSTITLQPSPYTITTKGGSSIPVYFIYNTDPETGIAEPVYTEDEEGNKVFKTWHFGSEQYQNTVEEELKKTVEEAEKSHQASVARRDAVIEDIRATTQTTGTGSSMWTMAGQRGF